MLSSLFLPVTIIQIGSGYSNIVKTFFFLPRYRWLDANFIGRAGKTVVKKLLLDQFVLTPQLLTVFYVSKYIVLNVFLGSKMFRFVWKSARLVPCVHAKLILLGRPWRLVKTVHLNWMSPVELRGKLKPELNFLIEQNYLYVFYVVIKI